MRVPLSVSYNFVKGNKYKLHKKVIQVQGKGKEVLQE